MIEATTIEQAIKAKTEETKRLMAIHKKLKAGQRLSVEEQSWTMDMVATAGGAMGLLNHAVSAQICQTVLGVTARRMYDYRQEGMPFETKNAYKLPAVVQWAFNRARGVGQHGEGEVRRKWEKERADAKAIQRERMALLLAKEKDEVLSRVAVEAQQEAKVKAVRQALDSLPRDLRGMVNRPLEDLGAWLDERISEICNRFAEEPE